MRCWALAEELEGRGIEVEWHSSIDVPWVQRALARQGWPVREPVGPPRGQAALTTAEAVVVDSYDLDLSYRTALLNRGIKVVAIVDDFHSVGGPASLWVNPGVKTGLEVADESAFLNGPEFVLIRREIRDLCLLREEFIRSGGTPDGVTVLLGGNDAGGLAGALAGLSEALGGAVDVVMGPGKPDRRKAGLWLRSGPELLKRAALSQLVISAAGVSSWEMLHIGVPLALVEATPNQAGNYRWMCEAGVVWPLGSFADSNFAQGLGARVKRIQEAVTRGAPHREPLIDGLGALRVAEALMRRCA